MSKSVSININVSKETMKSRKLTSFESNSENEKTLIVDTNMFDQLHELDCHDDKYEDKNVLITSTNQTNQTNQTDQTNQTNQKDQTDQTNQTNTETIDGDWQEVQKSKRSRKVKVKDFKKEIIDNVEDKQDTINVPAEHTEIDFGENLKFKHSYKIWVHLNDSQKWDITSFDGDFFIIDSVATFAQFFNNFYKFNLKTYSFYVMRSLDDGTYVEPTWEHQLNRNGGICSLRIDTMHSIELMQQLCMLMCNECLIPDMSLINGISFSTKNNWGLIKIWVRDKNVDISKLLPYAIVNSYPSLCIKYKMNVPEH